MRMPLAMCLCVLPPGATCPLPSDDGARMVLQDRLYLVKTDEQNTSHSVQLRVRGRSTSLHHCPLPPRCLPLVSDHDAFMLGQLTKSISVSTEATLERERGGERERAGGGDPASFSRGLREE